jgi:diguanylate cyclase (GGDEF)-like protein
MSDLPHTSPPRSLRRFIPPVLKCIALLAFTVGNWSAVWLLVATRPEKDPLVFYVAMPISVFATIAALTIWHAWRWRRPVRAIEKLIPAIRAGREPIDALLEIRGGPRGLANLLRDVLHDNRQQRQAVALLNEEIRQRVAVRTDALERQIGSLQMLASRDPLTGLCNRRALDRHLPELLERVRAEGRDLALLMVDIDHFKHLNDTLGHPAGDELLRDLGQIMRSMLRGADDVAFRCGGDEFVILLVGCDRASVDAYLGRLTSLASARARTCRVEPPPGLSLGVTLLSELTDPTPGKLLELADQRLYAAKRDSRTRRAG